MDLAERERCRTHAESLLPSLAAQGVVAVATSFVDNSGISRVKSVPLDRLPTLAAWGAGFSTAFDYFRFDDWVAAPPDGHAAVGDQRIVPDLDRLVVLSAQPGWAWAPGDRFAQTGEPHDQDARLLLGAMVDGLAARGITVRSAVEIEWVVSAGEGDSFSPAVTGPAYGLTRLTNGSDYSRDVLTALATQGVEVEQFHPEYAAGQFELSVAAESPVHAADTSVLVRATIRAVGNSHGYRTSFSPKVDAAGVGNGGHVHLSLWREGRNLMAGGSGRFGLSAEGESFGAGVLRHLPALLAVGAPGVASYLRLVPQHWAGAYACWGLENREAALRMVTGSTRPGERDGQLRGQVRRPPREPLPAARRAARRRRGRRRVLREAARARRRRSRGPQRGCARRPRDRAPPVDPARVARRVPRRHRRAYGVRSPAGRSDHRRP